MRLCVSGINPYYVQTLCMIFFPGEKFTEEAEDDGCMEVSVQMTGAGAAARAVLTFGGKRAESARTVPTRDDLTAERLQKIAVGHVVLATAGELVHYRPSWGMLTGVRPSKVATDLLLRGISKTRVRRMLASDYMVIPKKAALATDVAPTLEAGEGAA